MGLLSSITGALSGGLGNVVGSLVTGGASLLGGSMANTASAKSIAQQEAYQTEMSNTSYQRAVKDMQAAGLNPMLAYSQGGASTPSGSSYTAQDVMTPAVNSALASRRLSADLELNKMQQYAAKTQGVLNDTLAAKANTEAAQIAANSMSQRALNSALSVKALADGALSSAGLPAKQVQNSVYDVANKLVVQPLTKQLTAPDASARRLWNDFKDWGTMLPPPRELNRK